MGKNRPKGGALGGFDQLRAPDAPTISVTAGDTEISVAFTNPSDTGGGDISSYTATAIASGVSTGATSSSSPVTITGLTNDTSYSVTGLANNAFGSSPYSASSSATPAESTFAFLLAQNTYIDKFNMSSQSDTTSFADFSAGGSISTPYAISNLTRMVAEKGLSPDADAGKYLEYWSTSSGGSSTSFGELSTRRLGGRGTNNATRGIFSGGYTPSGFTGADVSDYITIASAGNATTFGNLTRASYQATSGNSDTRSINAGGYTTGFGTSEIIDYFTIASTGNATDFGDLTQARSQASSGHSNRTRSIVGGGNIPGSTVNTMDYITIASAGNATDFGDLVVAKGDVFAGVSSTTRWFGAIFFGQTKEIQTVQFASTGNTTNWADVTRSGFNSSVGGTSVAHGGIAS